MTRKISVLLIVATAAAAALVAATSDARQPRRRDLQQQPATELDITGISPDTLRKAYLGTWNDQLGRFWFTIRDISGTQVRSADFRLAHLKEGHIDGNRLALVSMSCVPLIHCYSYRIEGKLMSLSRMDMHATDETGDTVHFVLVRK